jgi:hypothetical protein
MGEKKRCYNKPMVSSNSHLLAIKSRRKYNQMPNSQLMLANLPLPALSPSPTMLAIPAFTLGAGCMTE